MPACGRRKCLPHLIHLVSHVEGTLLPGVGIREIIHALFPCGSITGAPKIRAMEILAEIEQVAAGDLHGRHRNNPQPLRAWARSEWTLMSPFATMVIENGRAAFNVGGGIVYDSNPEAEYAEVMLKAQPLFEALGARNEEVAWQP